MRKLYTVVIVCLLGLGLLVGSFACARPTPTPTPTPTPAPQPVIPSKLDIGTGTVGGMYYVIGTVIAKLLSEELDIPVTASPTEGSSENVRLLSQKRIDLVLVGGQVAYTAAEGLAGWEKHEDVSHLVAVTNNQQGFVALKGSGITRYSDLKGKRVGMGSSRATWGPLSGQILIAHGFKYTGDQWEPVFTEVEEVYCGMADAATMLGDGRLDAMLAPIVAGKAPIPAITELSTRKDLVLLEFTEQAFDWLEANVPYMSRAVLAAGALPVVKEPLHNVTVWQGGGPLLSSRTDTDEELAYLITKIIDENLDRLVKESPYFKLCLEDRSSLVRQTGMPYHSGATRYWKEVGLWKE